ncbi:MAG TPA: plastocyanin/azurin family copper-binding protein [Solirubrobacteraceae bacterium]
MRTRTFILAVLAAVLGAAVVVMPTLAGAEAPPSIEAVNYGLYSHYWRPATATVLPGGVVTFSNPYTETNHGLEFTSAAKPSCTGIPKAAGELSGAANWKGECTFAEAGSYTFICTVHPTEMKGTITVSAAGTTTTTTTTAPPPGSETGQTTTGGAGPGQQTAGGGSPLAGAAGTAVRVGAGPHASFLRGSVNISPAGAGGRLEVDVVATHAALARAGARTPVQVGRLVRTSLTAGVVTFRVSLSARALRALRAHGRLPVLVRVLVTAPHGAAVAINRHLQLHA